MNIRETKEKISAGKFDRDFNMLYGDAAAAQSR